MKNGLFKNFIVLLTGTAGAQLIHLLAAPVISRLYDADTFGEFGIIMGILGVLVVIVNGKFDAAILVPKGDSEAKKVFSISTLFGFLFSLLFAAIVIFISNEVSSKLNVNRAALGFTLYFCFIIAFNKSFIGWMTRKSMFREIAWGKILQTSGTVFFTILMYYAFPEIGLVVGTMFGWFIATFLYGIFIRKSQLFSKSNWRIKDLGGLFKTYKDFPLINAPSGALIAIAKLSILIYVEHQFTISDSGYFFHARQYVFAPLTMVSILFAQALFEKISSNIRTNQLIVPILNKVLGIMIAITIPIIIVFHLYGSEIFELVFGQKWIFAGIIVQTLIFSYVVQAISSPFGNVLNSLNKSRYFLILSLIYGISLMSLYLLDLESMNDFILYLCIGESLAYLIHLVVIYVLANQYDKRIKLMINK